MRPFPTFHRHAPALGIQLANATLISLLNSVSVSDTGLWSVVFIVGDQAGLYALSSILQQEEDMLVKKKVRAGLGQSLQW